VLKKFSDIIIQQCTSVLMMDRQTDRTAEAYTAFCNRVQHYKL